MLAFPRVCFRPHREEAAFFCTRIELFNLAVEDENTEGEILR